jgi:hypothetical protein
MRIERPGFIAATALFTAALCAWIVPSPARGQEPLDASAILAGMDKAISGYQDQKMVVTMTIQDVDGGTKFYDFTTWQKGRDKRLIRFTSGETKGMATLIEGSDRMYVYLPGFKKVRRVASHNMNQSFAGSDFTNNDMSNMDWSEAHAPVIESQDARAWTLKATVTEGQDLGYVWARLVVLKDGFYQERVEYFDAKGEMIKLMTTEDLKAWKDGVKRYTVVTLGDPRTGHKTSLTIREFEVDQGLKESMFSKRRLQWGR